VWQKVLGHGIDYEVFKAHITVIQQERNKGMDGEDGEVKETARLIDLDVPRTYSSLNWFQKEGTLHWALKDVLEAVSRHSTMGYCQGMSYLAATFLFYMEPYESFCCMSNLIAKPLHSCLFAMDVPEIVKHIRIFDILFSLHLPSLFEQFRELGIGPEQYLLDWFMTVFTKCLPVRTVHRVWDCFILEGEVFIYQTALGILKTCKGRLERTSFEECIHLLRNLPETDEELLFQAIFSIDIPAYIDVVIKRMQKEVL